MLGRQQGAGKVLALTAEVAARAGAEPHARVYACACARMFAELTVSMGGRGEDNTQTSKQTQHTDAWGSASPICPPTLRSCCRDLCQGPNLERQEEPALRMFTALPFTSVKTLETRSDWLNNSVLCHRENQHRRRGLVTGTKTFVVKLLAAKN